MTHTLVDTITGEKKAILLFGTVTMYDRSKGGGQWVSIDMKLAVIQKRAPVWFSSPGLPATALLQENIKLVSLFRSCTSHR